MTRDLERAGTIAAAANRESRTENERSAERRMNRIRDALAFETHELTDLEHQLVTKWVDALKRRVHCEGWGRQMGWRIPAYLTPDWLELFEAWLESPDDEEEGTDLLDATK